MSRWEYRKIDLTSAKSDAQEMEWLNEAGAEGWELVRITDRSVAYLKRRVENSPAEVAPTKS